MRLVGKRTRGSGREGDELAKDMQGDGEKEGQGTMVGKREWEGRR